LFTRTTCTNYFSLYIDNETEKAVGIYIERTLYFDQRRESSVQEWNFKDYFCHIILVPNIEYIVIIICELLQANAIFSAISKKVPATCKRSFNSKIYGK